MANESTTINCAYGVGWDEVWWRDWGQAQGVIGEGEKIGWGGAGGMQVVVWVHCGGMKDESIDSGMTSARIKTVM